MRAAKRRALGEEPNLYDEEEQEEGEENEELNASTDQEAHTNGAKPEELDYLETADEDELRTIISNIDDVVDVLLPIPEWKVQGKDGKMKIVTIIVRSLTSYERTQFLKVMNRNGVSNVDMTRMYADLVILSCRHPKTKRLLFKNADRAMLNEKMGAATERIARLASELSGLSEEFMNSLKKK